MGTVRLQYEFLLKWISAISPPVEPSKPVSSLAVISNFPNHPLSFFKELLKPYGARTVYMNVATIDREVGVLNRTVNFCGIVEKSIVYVTAQSARNYKNLIECPKCAVTFFFPPLPKKDEDDMVTWQVRLIDAKATELNKTNLLNFWQYEKIFSKIRYYMGDTGAPVVPEEAKRAHDEILSNINMGCHKLGITKNYTGFKVDACRWDFYKSEPNMIPDRLHYVKDPIDQDKWQYYHVAA